VTITKRADGSTNLELSVTIKPAGRDVYVNGVRCGNWDVARVEVERQLDDLRRAHPKQVL
jgi:hypothetical protein